MVFTKFRSRKLFLLLAFLLFDSDVFFSTLWSECQAELNSDACELLPARSAVPQDGLVWIADAVRELCLGLQGFEECGELNLWHLYRTPRGLQLRHHMHQDEDQACLGRMHPAPVLGLRSCKARHVFSGTYWQFDQRTGMLQSESAPSKLWGPTCISSTHKNHTSSSAQDKSESAAVVLTKCAEGFMKLKLLPYLVEEAGAEGGEGLIQEGGWRCPFTHQRLPRNLDAHLGGERQVLIGGGLFTKVGIVYCVTHDVGCMV
ncbi:hypothetical protein EON64_15380 [archaeon]|nr:MAG: hypothetical protein EON64_15380 [archaeon]